MNIFDQVGMANGMGGSGFWMLAGVLVIAAAVLIGGWLIARTNRDVRSRGSTPLDILRQGYARGEITKDEFDITKQTFDS